MEGLIIKQTAKLKYQQNLGIKEHALLIGEKKEEINELKRLSATAGIKVKKALYNNKQNIDPAYFIGKGKLNHIMKYINNNNINVVIFDDELSPAQHRNLSDALNTKIIDRTQLILDIFAQHAHTKESKIQVELAQLEYLLPRLKGKGTELSRLAGGIGTRGPGETKLEIDRRRIEKKIHRLKKQLKEIEKNRKTQRKNRKDPLITLVGYTNAGKSTLMNLLTDADSKVADKLFATLDSTLRKMELPNGRNVILSDTIGFINRLPHQLVASFKATLEEIYNADILIHVIDINSEQIKEKIETVNEVLQDLEINNKKIVKVFNKIDMVNEEKVNTLKLLYPDSIFISAAKEKGKDKLIKNLNQIIKKSMVTIKFEFPYEKAYLVEKIYEEGKVMKEKYLNDHIFLKASISNQLAQKLSNFQKNNSSDNKVN
ncbi:MAG: GTPase HflX [Halanaerobiaceae bacterium]